MVKNIFLRIASFVVATGMGAAWGQCEADATVYLTDFLFTPNELTISVGQSVAFVNAEGTHNVDGTAASNPVSFFFEQSEGNIEGVCMGTFTFDVPGVYTFTSSVGVQPELGMTGTIVVDAETLCDVLLSFWGSGENEDLDAYGSAYAFQSYFGCPFFGQSGGFPASAVSLDGLEEYTVFLPNGPAIEGLQELLNLNSFDLLNFTEGMVAGLSYHIVPGLYLAEDLQDGALLSTVEGQDIAVSVNGEGTVLLNGATILHEDIEAFNGVIHVIDEVLVPPGYPAATTWDAIEQSPDHTFFEQALLAEGLKEALRGQPILNDNEPAQGPFTVFAPTDVAFEIFAEANGFSSVEELLGSQFIDDIVRAHLVVSVYESEDLTDGSVLFSYNNEPINVGVEGESITANTAPVVDPDVMAYNGVVHVLGEVMPFEFPDAEGTCGAWTVVMTCESSDFGVGWQGSSLHVYADGEEIAAETMMSNGTESFSFPVDEGSRIDVVYNDVENGFLHGYSLLDAIGQVLFASSGFNPPGAESQPPLSIYGLRPCAESASCGLMEVTFFDEEGYGWYGGGMEIYSDVQLEASIFFNPDFNGDGYYDYAGFSSRTAFVSVPEGELDFVVSSPLAYPDQCGYVVRNPDEDLVVEANAQGQFPQSVFNVDVCGSDASDARELESVGDWVVLPNPAVTSFRIHGMGGQESWSAQLFGLDGKCILERQGVGAEPVLVEDLAPGVYQLLVQSGEGLVQAIRLVKK